MRKDCQKELKLASALQNQDIKSKAAKLLDSSTASVSAPGASLEPRYDEEILIAPSPQQAGWYYLMLKNKDIRRFNDILTGRTTVTGKDGETTRKYRFQFRTFIYTALNHRRHVDNVRYTESEYQQRMSAALRYEATDGDAQSAPGSPSAAETTVGAGYLFVYAPLQALSQALDMIVPHRFLVMDLGTRKPARVPDTQMHDFIFLYETAPWNVQFMQHPISQYARDRQLVRITGGKLKGAEGYIVRIHRDRTLVFSFGNMTLAVTGIHAFPLEAVNNVAQ